MPEGLCAIPCKTTTAFSGAAWFIQQLIFNTLLIKEIELKNTCKSSTIPLKSIDFVDAS